MSRDGEPTAPEMPEIPDASRGLDELELLTAYVDGVAELAPDERHPIEARLADDPAARADQAAVRRLLDRLRDPEASAAPGTREPDWAAMERSIRAAVGDAVPRPWWRRWTWLAPAATFACAIAVVVALWPPRAPTSRTDPGPTTRAAPRVVVAPAVPAVPAVETTDVIPLWLDGAEVDVDAALVPHARELLALTGERADHDPPEPAIDGGPEAEPEAEPGALADGETRLLPTTDLAWVDHLDDDALERAERWLAGRPGKRG